MRDYLAMRKREPGDKEDHGVLGMKWGRRRTDAQLAADTKKRAAEGAPVTPTAKAKAAVTGDAKPDAHGSVGETSQEKYHRLAAVAKGGGANTLSDADLKFYNSRTEALSKINKMNAKKPGWLAETTKTVIQQAAQKSMQDVANAVTGKYVTTPMTDAIKGTAKEAAKSAAKN